MTNYGIPFNDHDYSPDDLVALASVPNPFMARKARDTLDFILTPKEERIAQSEWRKQNLAMLALQAKRELPAFPWEAKQPGYDDEEVPNMPAWWKRAVAPPRWLRLLIRLRIVTPRPASQVFKDWRRDEEQWEAKFPNTPFRYPGDPYRYERMHRKS